MQETCNHLHELQLKETNQYFIFVSQGNHKKKRSNIFFDIFLQGFDEYMNLVLDDAEEVHLKTKKRRPLGMDFFSKICIELSYCKMPQM